MATHYDILKVAFDAPDAVIRAAYRVLAAGHHPDRHGAADPQAAQRMQRINEAYRVLSCATARARYDAHLAAQRRRRASDSRERDLFGRRETPSPAAPAPVAPIAPPLVSPIRRRAAALYAEHAALG